MPNIVETKESRPWGNREQMFRHKAQPFVPSQVWTFQSGAQNIETRAVSSLMEVRIFYTAG